MNNYNKIAIGIFLMVVLIGGYGLWENRLVGKCYLINGKIYGKIVEKIPGISNDEVLIELVDSMSKLPGKLYFTIKLEYLQKQSIEISCKK